MPVHATMHSKSVLMQRKIRWQKIRPLLGWPALPNSYTTSDPDRQVLLLGLRDFPYQEYARHIPLVQALAIRDNYERVVVDALIQLVAKRPNW